MNRDQAGWSRRDVLSGLTLAGAAGLLGVRPAQVAAEPPPETTRLRLVQTPSICVAPQYVAKDLLHGEGFSDVQYVKKDGGVGVFKAVASGEADIGLVFSGPLIVRVDSGDPIIMLAGGHIGCLEVFGTDRVHSIRDLKGKTVSVLDLGGVEHVFLASMAAYVGLDPQKDINWVTHPRAEAVRLLAEGQVDALLLSPPGPQELRAKQIGHVLVNTSVDKPWSQYFCCVVAGGREFIQKHPVATKRALRAILKGADICALEPERAARSLAEKGIAPRYDYAFQAMKDIPYGKWRDSDPEDTVRFYSLRLREAGMIKSSPQKILAQGTDWRFLNQLKKELKA